MQPSDGEDSQSSDGEDMQSSEGEGVQPSEGEDVQSSEGEGVQPFDDEDVQCSKGEGTSTQGSFLMRKQEIDSSREPVIPNSKDQMQEIYVVNMMFSDADACNLCCEIW